MGQLAESGGPLAPGGNIIDDLIEGGKKRFEAAAYTAAIRGFSAIFGWVSYGMVSLVHGLVGIAAAILEISVTLSTFQMGTYEPIWKVVRNTWVVIRDLGNTLFVFALLWAAFNTVLGHKNGAKDILPRVIIVALLVNFSFLISITIIDMSNSLAANVYAELKGANNENLGDRFVKAGGIESFLNGGPKDADGWFSNPPVVGGAWSALKGLFFTLKSGITGKIDDSTLALFQQDLGRMLNGVFMLILAFFILAIAFTLLARFVMLVMLTALSAGAFVAYIFPALESQTRKWWSMFVSQALYAPATFLMLLVVLGVQSEISKNMTTLAPASGVSGGETMRVIATGAAEFVKFTLLMFFLGAAMKLSKLLADRGGKMAVNLGQRAQRAAGAMAMGGTAAALRGSLGWAGAWASNNEALKAMRDRGGAAGLLGRGLLGVAGKAQSASFDIRNTGAAKLLAKQTGMDFGKAGGKGGFKGIAEAQQKEYEKRVAEIAKNEDLSAADKKAKIDEIVASDSKLKAEIDGLASEIATENKVIKDSEAEMAKNRLTMSSTFSTDREKRDAEASNKKLEGTIDVSRAKIKAAEDKSDSLKYSALNKKLFGVNSDDKYMNHSIAYAQAMRRDAYTRGSMKSVLAAGAGAVGLLASGPLGLALGMLGAMGSGRLISGAMRGAAMKTPVGGFLPRMGGSRGSYVSAKDGKVKKQANFWQAAGINPAIEAALDKVEKNVVNFQKAQDELAEHLNAIKKFEASGTKIDEELHRKTKRLEEAVEKAEKKLGLKKDGDKKKKDPKKDGGGDADKEGDGD